MWKFDVFFFERGNEDVELQEDFSFEVKLIQ